MTEKEFVKKLLDDGYKLPPDGMPRSCYFKGDFGVLVVTQRARVDTPGVAGEWVTFDAALEKLGIVSRPAPWPRGIWYMELQECEGLRGDEKQVTEALLFWVDRSSSTPEERAARTTFADGFLFGMKWSGAFVKAE